MERAEELLCIEAAILEKMTVKQVLANALVSEEQTKVWKAQLQAMALACRQVAAEVTIEISKASSCVVRMSAEAAASLRKLAEETYVGAWALGNAAKRWGGARLAPQFGTG